MELLTAMSDQDKVAWVDLYSILKKKCVNFNELLQEGFSLNLLALCSIGTIICIYNVGKLSGK